jgi:hypothetical protein
VAVPVPIGLGLIVFLSDWNQDANGTIAGPDWLPFGWDMVVTAAFSLIIYYWAVNTAIDGEGILQIADETAAHAEQETAELGEPIAG